MRYTRWFVGFLLALLCASGALAQPLLKPGLWEITSQTTIDGKAMPNMQDMFKNMPPAQRKQMEAMMAKQGVGMGAGGSNAVKVCMTPEHARQALTQQPQGTQNCNQQAIQQIANTMKYSFICTNPKTQGDGAATWNSDNTQFTTKVTGDESPSFSYDETRKRCPSPVTS